MDIVVLGLLMMGRFSIYELRKIIDTNFSSMASNSMGSIQAVIKKLLEHGDITYTELAAHGVTKKCYMITDSGKQKFQARLHEPMQFKEKNMELVKFFFMGFLKSPMRISQLQAYISDMQTELKHLQEIDTNTRCEFDEAYISYLKELGAQAEVFQDENDALALDRIQEIAKYQRAMLAFAIAKTEFEIAWFTHFIQKNT